MKLWKLNEQQKWNDLVSKSPDGGLLQSWQWGEFQESLSNAVYNISDNNERWLAQCLQLRAGTQWILSVPRGPIYTGNDKPNADSLIGFLRELKQFAKKKGCFLVRFDPAWSSSNSDLVETLLKAKSSLKFLYKSKKERNPVHTLIVDTSSSEDDLLAGMKSKWRYNIKVAQKKGVEIEWSNDPKMAIEFARLMNKTTDRQKFGSYDAHYFSSLVEKLSANDMAMIALAKYQRKYIAGLLVGFSGKHAYYLHGASDYEHRSLMAPHLLQWEAIKEAKRRGCNYDLWGVASDPPSNEQEKSWLGITRFKKGFTPSSEVIEYVGTYELAVKIGHYWLYRGREVIRH